MTNQYLKLSCIVLIFFSSGCATRKEIVKFQADALYISQQVQALRQENEKIQKMLIDLNKKILNLQDETRKTRADLLVEIENIKSQSLVIDSKLADTVYRLPGMFQKTTGENNHSASDSAVAAIVQQQPLPETEIAFEIDPQTLYNTAYKDLVRGNYQLALEGYQEFLDKFPESDLAGNAQYWIGETYYARGEYQTALEEFKKVILNYPRMGKVAAAILKMGYCSIRLNDLSAARMYLNSIMQHYPNSEEAKLARSRLDDLK